MDNHPTVLTVRGRTVPVIAGPIDSASLRALCLAAGADDVGFVSVNHAALDDERKAILALFPKVKTIVCFVCRMNVEPIRTTARSIANREFHQVGDHVNDVAHSVVRQLAERGIASLNPPMAFPMEMDHFPGKVWTLSLKPLAVAAGLGKMGIHRNIIHPKFGNFILIGAVLVGVEVTETSHEIAFNPCLECNLCVAACPVGAISTDGSFNFASCYTHNYHEFMGGFTDWVETIADSGSGSEYRRRVSDGESASMWQSLSFGANYKAAYCMAVCPAGEDVILPFIAERGEHVRNIVKPLQKKVETIYVRPNSDAEEHVEKRFPHKRLKYVGRVLRPATIEGFLSAIVHIFQPGKAANLNAVYHMRFTGKENAECTITIANQTIDVKSGLVGKCNLQVTASSRHWLRFLRGDANIVWLLITFRVRLRGNPRLLAAFGRCFP